MNKEYILNKIKPYLNDKGMLPEDDFNNLFSRLTHALQYEIIDILIEENIDIDFESQSIKAQNITIIPKAKPENSPKLNKLTNEQLCVIFQNGNELALDALVSKNTRLVWSRVLKYNKRYKHKLDEEDLAQYGTMGLIMAAKKFDLKKEAMFTTYAIWWIDQHILRSIADFGFTIRIPVHYFEQVNRLVRVLSQNPDCTKQQIYELIKEERGITREKFEETLMTMENIISLASLNTHVGDDENSELGDLKEDDINPGVEEQVEYSILKETIASILETLSPRERDIIEQRFGLKDGVARTLEQIGANYSVTRERIRQIEAKAINKLRHPTRSIKLSNFY